MKRRSFITALLAAPAALFALARSVKAQPTPPTTESYRYPRETTFYQRLYTKLEYRQESHTYRTRSFWINGTSANGERDVFYQHQRKTSAGWEVTSTFRYSHRDDINNRIISYPKVRVDLALEVISLTAAVAPWAKGVVAIAKWTETKGRA